MSILFEIQRTGNNFFATADGGSRFFVGKRVPYKGNIGLYNIFEDTPLQKLNYAAKDFTATLGFWANFIEPTAKCEGRNFLTLNTYDRAVFTFGFGQFAAHVPNGDFVRFFRALLATPKARDYFPHLVIKNGHIHSTGNSGKTTPLEDDDSTDGLKRYLNPSLDEVEDSEVIAAAKFIHWTANDEAARQLQVDQMVATFRGFMRRAEGRVAMDNRPAPECCIIADILHHGRGGKMTWPLIDEALKSSTPFDSLLAIGSPEWDERRKTLRKAIAADSAFATQRWDTTAHDFR